MFATLEAKIIGAALGLTLLVGAYSWHKHAVSAAYNRGKADEAEHIKAKAISIKDAIDTLTVNISSLIRSKTDEENSRIAGVADALKLRGPGRAVCPGSASPAAGASGRNAPVGPAGATVDRVPYPEWGDLIAMPFPPTIDFAKGHDQCQVELRAYRQQRKELEAAWKQLADQLKDRPKHKFLGIFK